MGIGSLFQKDPIESCWISYCVCVCVCVCVWPLVCQAGFRSGVCCSKEILNAYSSVGIEKKLNEFFFFLEKIILKINKYYKHNTILY